MTDPTHPERIFATATRAKGSSGQIGTWREADDGTGRVEYVRADLVRKLLGGAHELMDALIAKGFAPKDAP